MQKRRKSTNASSLLQAGSCPGRERTVFGTILDATGHYKTNDSIDYVTRLKVVDHSLNANRSRYSDATEPFICVFIFSESVEDAPQFGRIGDIIRLERFQFANHGRMIKAVFNKRRSAWSVFDGRKNANNTPTMSSPGNGRLNESDKAALQKLRNWTENYFASKSLQSMSWFKRAFPSSREKGKVYELKDVDVVVRLVNELSVQVDGQFYHKLAFADRQKNVYLAEMKGLLTGADKGDVMKLRSVSIQVKDNEFKVDFSSYSNFMVLRKSFKDTKDLIAATKSVSYSNKKLKSRFLSELHLDKRVKKVIGPNCFVYSSKKENKGPLNLELIKRTYEEAFPILRNFEYSPGELQTPTPHSKTVKRRSRSRSRSRSRRRSSAKDEDLKPENFGRGSAILKDHANLPVTTLADLAKIIKKKKSKKFLNQVYRVRTSIQTIKNETFQSNFKIFSQEQSKTYGLNTKKRNFKNDEKVIFYNIFGLRDDSLSKKDQPVPAYLITYNDNPNYVFDLWRLLPDPLSVADWLNLETSRSKKFEKCLSALKAPGREFELALQVVRAETGKVYLKIIDSIFWIVDQA